jgi:hypothetical protein
MQATLWTGCAAAAGLAALASLADRRRNNRADPDKVGFMPWPLILVLSLLVSAVLAAFALKVS